MSLSGSLRHFRSKRQSVTLFSLYIGVFHPIQLRLTPCHQLLGPIIPVTPHACPEALLRGLRAGEYLPQSYSQTLVFSSLVLMSP